MIDKNIHWIGSSQEAGFALWKIQQGKSPPDFKPMAIVGKGVQEIRIQTEDAYRVFYVAKFEEAIYVIHVFQKKTQKTSQNDIELGQQRYKTLLKQRQNQEKPS